jgi:hypothetical protein
MKNELTISQKRRYLKSHGWYQLWDKDNWLVKDKEYNNPDWQGLDTEDAFNMEIEYGNPHEQKNKRIYMKWTKWIPILGIIPLIKYAPTDSVVTTKEMIIALYQGVCASIIIILVLL